MGNHRGSIYKLPNGTWRAVVTIDGKRLSKRLALRRDAQAWLQEINEQADRGLTYEANKTKMSDFLDGWLVSIEGILTWTTHSHYEMCVRREIKPALGKLVMKDVTPGRIQAFYDRLAKDGQSKWQIQFIHRTLKKALKHAVGLGLLSSNPTDAVIRPVPKQEEMQILNEGQVNQLLASASGHRLEALYYLAISTGARIGELLGLKWDDVDFNQRTVRFLRQIKYKPGELLIFSDLKTKYSRRTVDLGASTLGQLRVHQERQWLEKTAMGEGWANNDLVFTTTVGTPIYPRNMLREFKTQLERAGLQEIRFHDLRHTAAALMLNHNVPVIVVSRRLGHSRPSITMDIYGHLIPGIQSQAAELIDEIITPVEVKIK